MSKPSAQSLAIWRWLLARDSRCTAYEIADALGIDEVDARRSLYDMTEMGTVATFPPLPGRPGQLYAITGTCNIPRGLKVAEVQAC